MGTAFKIFFPSDKRTDVGLAVWTSHVCHAPVNPNRSICSNPCGSIMLKMKVAKFEYNKLYNIFFDLV